MPFEEDKNDHRWWTACALAAGFLATQVAHAGPAAAALRVCLPDIDMPPYNSRDPGHPALFDRLLVDAGQSVGLQVQVLRLPSARCRVALERGDVEAMPLPASAVYLQELDFPLGAQGRPDAALRLARLQFVLLRRRGEALEWDGQRVQAAGAVLVGIRRGVATLSERLGALGLAVDDRAVSNVQLLQKLAAKRIDLAAMSRGEFEQAQQEQPGLALEMLAQPLLSADIHLAVSRRLSPALQARIPAWREQIGRLRESPAYQVP